MFCECTTSQGCVIKNIIRLTQVSIHRSGNKIFSLHSEKDTDYTANTFEGSPPDRFDVEIFKASSIIESEKKSILPSEREHVTFNFINSENIQLKSELKISSRK